MSDHTLDEELYMLNNIISDRDDSIKELYIQIDMLERQLDDRKPTMCPNGNGAKIVAERLRRLRK